MTNRVQYLIEQSVQSATNDAYKSSFKKYKEFCHQYGIQPLPLTETKAIYWMAYRTGTVKASTALSGYYGVKKMAAFYGQKVDDSQWPLLKQVKTSLHTVFGADAPDKRKPITFELLAQMYKYFNLKNYNELVYYTLMVCATTALLRTSEFCAKHKKVNAHQQDKASVQALWNRNLTPHLNSQGTQVTHYSCKIQASKNEKGKCTVDVVWAQGNWPVSPCELITQMIHAKMNIINTKTTKLSMDPTAPLFQLLDGSIVTVKDVKNRLTKLCNDMGLDPSKYTIYSFRIGGATSLARRGVDHRQIQIAGRWRSEAYGIYIRMSIKSMATNQADYLKRDILNREVVFLHQNMDPNMAVRA